MTNNESARHESAIDHENNCAACGVYGRQDGSRYCAGCHEALVEA